MREGYLRRTWVSPKIKGCKSSIHGDGVFVAEPIAEGEALMRFGGELIGTDDANSSRYRSRTVWPVEPGSYLALPVTDTSESLDENLNHSCDPTGWLADAVTIVARRPLALGQEVTLDQGTWNFEWEYADNKASCSCGAGDCRGKLTSEDWKRLDIQQKYRGHFHPLVQKLIEASTGEGGTKM